MTAALRPGREGVDLVISWGLGVDSTAYLVKMLDDPAAHGVDLARTMVIHQLTGSEWPTTRAHAEQFVLPLLRKHQVRLVQVSRSSRALAIAVMDDSRRPERIVQRGPWELWDEYETNGTVPQQGGIRICSLHAKGEVGDALIAALGGAGRRGPGSRSRPEAAERLGAARCARRGRRALRAGAGVGPAARADSSDRGGADGHRPVPCPGQAGAALRTGVGGAPLRQVVTRSGCRRD